MSARSAERSKAHRTDQRPTTCTTFIRTCLWSHNERRRE